MGQETKEMENFIIMRSATLALFRIETGVEGQGRWCTHVWQTNQLGNKQEDERNKRQETETCVGFAVRDNDSIRC